MTQLRLAPELGLDIARIVAHLHTHQVADVQARIDQIIDALDILRHHPQIGRPAPQGQSKLVIGRDSRGYVALYRFDELEDTVVVLALRSQKEVAFVDH